MPLNRRNFILAEYISGALSTMCGK